MPTIVPSWRNRVGGIFKPARFLPALLAGSFYLAQIQGSYGQLISQYVETNSGSNPKGVEIWNQTGAAIDFSVTPLVIEKGNNGGTPATDITVSSGTLAPNAVMVIGTSDMGTYLTDQGLGSVQFVTKAFTFNGDDALVLKIGGVIKDTIGVPGVDPGAAWTGSGVSTADQNIQLKTGITTSPSASWSDPSERYETVSTTPATLPAGLTGFGIAPASGGPDITPPVISSRTPDVGATGVTINPVISITFDEPIAASTGTVHLFKEAGETDEEIPIGSVVVSTPTASFAPLAALDYNTTYYVLVDATAFTDTASPTPNAFEGILSETDWTFVTETPDIDPPVATLSPADDETAVPSAANLVITYDEGITVGSGVITLYKAGGTMVQTFDVETDVVVSGNSLTINPTLLLAPDTGYYLDVPAGVVVDDSSNANPSDAIDAPSGWNFTTRAVPSVVINQYYEGADSDRYIELKNTTSSAVSLDGYRLTVWSNTAPSDNEGWKSGTGTTDREVIFGGLATIPTIAANSTLLIANVAAMAPPYAASSANLKENAVDEATFFNGDDSVVLYFGAGNERANVVDVVSVVGTEATDTSFYRLTDTPAFNFDIGSSIVDDLGQAWQQIAYTAVDNATSADPFYLQAYEAPAPPTLSTFSVGKGATTAVTPRVTLDFTSADGTPTEYLVSESSDFSGATWTAMPGTSPVVDLSAGNGTKTLYFKIRNTFGESAALSDSIERASFTSAGTVIFTQYYEGASNNKYLEITNTSASQVNLSTWKIVRWGNAEAENWKITDIVTGSGSGVVTLSGILAAGQTVVLSNSSASSPVSSGSAYISSSNINHTGNDSYGLYEGAISAENLRDALSFTAANEGPNTSFVRISPAMGFDFDEGTSIETYPAVWEEVAYTVVDAATSDQKEYLGTYLDTVPVGYASWIDSFFMDETDPLIIGFSADPDGDGIPNGVEALIGGNPNSPGVFSTTELTKSGSDFTFLYPQAKTVPTGVTASYEWSADLANWQGDGESFGGTTVALSDTLWDDTGEESDIYQVTASVTAGAASTLFVRVKANN